MLPSTRVSALQFLGVEPTSVLNSAISSVLPVHHKRMVLANGPVEVPHCFSPRALAPKAVTLHITSTLFHHGVSCVLVPCAADHCTIICLGGVLPNCLQAGIAIASRGGSKK